MTVVGSIRNSFSLLELFKGALVNGSMNLTKYRKSNLVKVAKK
jgi:hypothetical protein